MEIKSVNTNFKSSNMVKFMPTLRVTQAADYIWNSC